MAEEENYGKLLENVKFAAKYKHEITSLARFRLPDGSD